MILQWRFYQDPLHRVAAEVDLDLEVVVTVRLGDRRARRLIADIEIEAVAAFGHPVGTGRFTGCRVHGWSGGTVQMPWYMRARFFDGQAGGRGRRPWPVGATQFRRDSILMSCPFQFPPWV